MTEISDCDLALAHSVFNKSCRIALQGVTIRQGIDGEIRLAILSQSQISQSQTTEVASIRLHVRENQDLIWISDLRVSPEKRLQGFGRELVEAAEALTSMLGYARIHLFPLATVRPFWQKMGYRPVPRISQVLGKTIVLYMNVDYLAMIPFAHQYLKKIAEPQKNLI